MKSLTQHINESLENRKVKHFDEIKIGDEVLCFFNFSVLKTTVSPILKIESFASSICIDSLISS